MRVVCQHHDGEVAAACGNCNKLFCGECDIQDEQCTGESSSRCHKKVYEISATCS